jgi:maltose alpha-D-glucosyltransferase/alpha-amylase
VLGDLWYKNALVYNLDVETFLDADGDGVGDFEGLMRRLDYVESLGVDVLWLAPFQPSPNRDNGYDVADFYGVDPRYGSSGDFVEFVHRARSNGIRVIVDLVVNHTSDRHRWFREAREGPDSSRFDWYVWSKKRPSTWRKGTVFPGHQQATWSRDPQAKQWYFHRFFDFQPDLNMQNPAVREEIRRIMGFWLELGVSGFRVDAVPFIIEEPPTATGPPALHFEYLEELRDFLQWRVGDAVLLGEANVLPKETKDYFRNGDGIHLMFNFWVNQHLWYALASGDARPLQQALRDTAKLPPSCQWAHFLRNHDELDLGRLTEEQRATVFERFGPDEGMQLYGRGIRRRLSAMLGERPLVELAFNVLYSLPGTPVLWYGDELGMGDDLRLQQRDAVRTPMQWSAERNAGFTKAEKPFRPVVSRGPYAFEHVNVEHQRRHDDSLLRWNTRMIRMRKECPEIGWGDWRLLGTRNPAVLGLRYDWRGDALLVLHNFRAEACEVTFATEARPGEPLSSLTDPIEIPAVGDGGRYRVALEAYGSAWFRIGSLDYALD